MFKLLKGAHLNFAKGAVLHRHATVHETTGSQDFKLKMEEC